LKLEIAISVMREKKLKIFKTKAKEIV